MNTTDDPELDALFDRIESGVPATAGFISWVRRPSSRFVRIPLGILLILGGVLSFLPILGIWMLPLGLLMLAIDVPPLRKPVIRAVNWIETRWEKWRNRNNQKR